MTQNNNAKNTVLFVDDEEKARKMFIRLASSEFEVLTAADVKEAMQILESHADQIGVLITDQRMPGLQGVDLLRHVREKYPKIIRLLTTAYSDLNDAIDAVNKGEIFRYINKPWNVDELLIDLNLAMSFFILQQDRAQLIQEKLSVILRQTTTNNLKNLIASASAHIRFQHPQEAVESMLQQLAEPYNSFANLLVNNPQGYWVNDVEQAQRGIIFNRNLSQFLQNSDNFLLETDDEVPTTAHWEIACDTTNISLVLNTEVNQAHFSQAGLSQLLLGLQQIFSEGNLNITVDEDEASLLVLAQSSIPNTWLAQDFLTTTQEEQLRTLAQFLGIFILTYHAGGEVKLGFNENQLDSIAISVPRSKAHDNDNQINTDDTVWIEDLLVNYN